MTLTRKCLHPLLHPPSEFEEVGSFAGICFEVQAFEHFVLRLARLLILKLCFCLFKEFETLVFILLVKALLWQVELQSGRLGSRLILRSA